MLLSSLFQKHQIPEHERMKLYNPIEPRNSKTRSRMMRTSCDIISTSRSNSSDFGLTISLCISRRCMRIPMVVPSCGCWDHSELRLRLEQRGEIHTIKFALILLMRFSCREIASCSSFDFKNCFIQFLFLRDASFISFKRSARYLEKCRVQYR